MHFKDAIKMGQMAQETTGGLLVCTYSLGLELCCFSACQRIISYFPCTYLLFHLL